ncbi:MAG: hypothetical protein DRP66_06515 [Planctomycetota bacterium]|nr:MAG: hypothetical protein DRP66_06515 [Planctomycetota bacterium]
MPYGTLTVLGSHSCVALSPVKATELYHTMPEAQSVKLKGFAGKSVRKQPTLLHESHKKVVRIPADESGCQFLLRLFLRSVFVGSVCHKHSG